MSQTKTQPYVKPLAKNSAPSAAQSILEQIEAKFGQSMNIFNTMAYQPDVLKGMTTLNDGLQNDLPEKYRELAYFLASQINECDYCSHYHKQAAKKANVTEDQFSEIGDFESSDAFDEQEKAILRIQKK